MIHRCFRSPFASFWSLTLGTLLLLMVAPGAPLSVTAQEPSPPPPPPDRPVEEPDRPVEEEALEFEPLETDVEAEAELLEEDLEEGLEPVAPVADAEAFPGEEPAEAPAWDVGDPPLPFTEVAIDVDEGTWISLDVSPDGREIVFDLLGDLYLLPIEGGEARPITSGVAWNMHPRFSPDGRSVAFTSDRGGGDNIWIVDRDGANPRQVTRERFRLVNSPAWTPDGDFVVVRKHFTSRRSAGAGEMWLYHRSGGDGLQMTRRPNDQKDAGEPAFSPDGRVLYFSQDITPGDVFEYNKDPNRQIYVIRRLDRDTGELTTYIDGPGGAVRPTPSPDGARLAFVRRVRGDSVLHLFDVTSGESWPVYGGLDRDMQETWAIHGVYPAMAWAPDSGSLVFWAGGKIRRLDVASGEVAEIPFRVRDTRRVAEALRFPVETHPERFSPRMLRWMTVSPQGDRVVYEALGRLWIRDLPEGSARPLTGQEEHFELYPSFSRDGRWIVYATWHDRELGALRVAPAGGGPGRRLTVEPGHYVEPVFTPDGRAVVFRRIPGSYLTSRAWGQETGVFLVPAAGGEAILVTREGMAPRFAADSSRVFLIRFQEEGRRALVSLYLDGSDERTHLTSQRATEMEISPDGRWVAFREEFHAYVIPFPRTGQTVEIGPEMTSLPITRVSRDAGEYLHWSGDGRRLHWALGPDLFSRELAEIFDFLPGAPAELPGPPERGLDVSLLATSDRPVGTIALVGGRVVTMRGDEVLEDATVVIEENRIAAVGPRQRVRVPAGAHVVDVTGHTVIPGLIDVHWHGAMGHQQIVPQQNWYLLSSLAFGVTTVHDPSNDTASIFAAAELARVGRITAPRIFSTGTILYGAEAPFRAVINSLEDARQHLRRMQAVGAFTVKSYNQPRRDQRQQVIAAARELGMMVVPEGGSLLQHNLNMVVDGHTGIEHAIPVAAIYDDVVQLWAGSRTGYTPTLGVAYGGWWGENYWYAATEVWNHERLLTFMPREIVDARARRRETIPEEELNHTRAAAIAAQLEEAGVHVQIGAHGQREGLAAHWELWMLVQGGMTPQQALRSGTLRGAQYLGLDHHLGSTEPGKLADLAVLSENPLEDIRNSDSVRWVMVNGRLYDAATMDQVAPDEVPRRPFYWELAPGELGTLPRAGVRVPGLGGQSP
jgi:imidazolonepropionase-like amidohydrolase/Tol biopolymer transport system component